jgi:hypothetical protein
MSINIQPVAVFPFGTYTGQITFYSQDQSDITSATNKTEVDLIVILSMVDNSDSGVIKISFQSVLTNTTTDVLAVYERNDCIYTANFTNLSVYLDNNYVLDGIIEFKNNKSLKLRLYGLASNDDIPYSVASSSILKGVDIC